MRYKIHTYIAHGDGTYSNKNSLDQDLINGWLVESVNTNSQRVFSAYPGVTYVTVVIKTEDASLHENF